MVEMGRALAFAVALFAVAVADDQGNVVLRSEGDNVCTDQKLVNVTLNVTHMEVVSVKEFTWCLQLPPRCAVVRQRQVPRSRAVNVTRIERTQHCCPGYEQTDDRCTPVCSDQCNHGKCVEPNVCICDAGWSGPACDKLGCPGGNWGRNCAKSCSCLNGGRCEPNTGICQCLPGFQGLLCQEKCANATFGVDCGQTCSCPVAGYRCHHVTGDCAPCAKGTFGDECRSNCTCTGNGTALCFHENGFCFCKPNFYGAACQLYCPFGFLDGVCYDKPLKVGTCSCSSDLFRCDERTGCVCKDGIDCSVTAAQVVSFAPLSQKDDGDSAEHSQAAVIVGVILMLALIGTALAALYYRRRTRRLKKDLENRSVIYMENNVAEASQRSGHSLVVSNEDPLSEEIRLRSRTPSGRHQNEDGRPDKNVNLDRLKLAEIESEASASEPRADVNVYKPSPAAKKDNAKLYRKSNNLATASQENLSGDAGEDAATVKGKLD